MDTMSPLNSARSVHSSQRTHRSADLLTQQRFLLFSMSASEQVEADSCMRELENFDTRFVALRARRPKIADSSRRSLPLTLPSSDHLDTGAALQKKRGLAPRSPRQRDVAAAFSSIDANGNGVLSRAEVIKACRRDEQVRALLGLPAIIREGDGREDFESVFQQIDCNDSKDINFEEFNAFVGAITAPAAAPAASATGAAPLALTDATAS